MSLRSWRSAVSTAVATGLGITVHPFNVMAPDPPCALVDPGEPYLSFDGEDETTFSCHTVRWNVWIVVRGAGEEESLDQLDDLIDDLIDRLLVAVPAVIPPEDDAGSATVERVETPTLLDIGGTSFLVVKCFISAIRPN